MENGQTAKRYVAVCIHVAVKMAAIFQKSTHDIYVGKTKDIKNVILTAYFAADLTQLPS